MLCPVCHAQDTTPEATAAGYTVMACAACGARFVDPLPTAETQHAIYDDHHAGATTGYYAKAEKKLRRSRRRVRLLDRHALRRATFLDVGSADGYMVEAMRERGYRATGVEPDKPGIAFARARFPANTFLNGLLHEVAGALGVYDVVHCSEVIEHVPEPRGFVATLAAHLAMGGVLNLTTPDVGHWNKPADITRWAEFKPPEHCVYYTARALRRLLAAHGLEVFHQRANWKAGLQVYARKVFAP